MDYDQALDEVISAAVWWYCTDTNQRRLRNAVGKVPAHAQVYLMDGLMRDWVFIGKPGADGVSPLMFQ
jgi:hypothetical protein